MGGMDCDHQFADPSRRPLCKTPAILNNKVRIPLLLSDGMPPYRRFCCQPGRHDRAKARHVLLIAISSLTVETGSVRAADLSWSCSGQVAFASGRENVRCRAQYSRRSNEGYVVRAVCATASGRAAQTASLRKIADNRYRAPFTIASTAFPVRSWSTCEVTPKASGSRVARGRHS
jgi:hypothetical protein